MKSVSRQIFVKLISSDFDLSLYTASNGHHRNHRHIRSVRIQPIPTVSRDTVDNNGLYAQPKMKNGHNNGHAQPKNGHIIPASSSRNSNNNTNNPRPRVHYETRAKRFFNRLRRVSRRVHFIRRLSRRIRRDQIGPPLQPRIAVNPAMRPIGRNYALKI